MLIIFIALLFSYGHSLKLDEACLTYYRYSSTDDVPLGDSPIKSLPNEFPHVALIGYGENETDKEWRCGGSLVSNKYVLTAAHCLFSYDGPPKWVRLGEYDLEDNTHNAKRQDHNIKRVIPHPDYGLVEKYPDIGLIELDQEVKFTSYVSPACIHTTKSINGTTLSTTGVGLHNVFSNEPKTVFLKEKQVLVDIETCQKYYKPVPTIDDESHICGGDSQAKDQCTADGGGPLQITEIDSKHSKKVNVIVGVVSLGKQCGFAPIVYTRVSHYAKWLESIL